MPIKKFSPCEDVLGLEATVLGDPVRPPHPQQTPAPPSRSHLCDYGEGRMHWPLDTEAPGTGHFSLRIMGEPALCYTDVQGGKTLCLLAKMKGLLL